MDNHRKNVQIAYDWLKDNIPEIVQDDEEEFSAIAPISELIKYHDDSRYDEEEFELYADRIIGDRPIDEKFQKAWIRHIQFNPHHWQHWTYYDENKNICHADMCKCYIVEMFCNHWSFFIADGNWDGIFDWYEKYNFGENLSEKTRKIYEEILDAVRVKLNEQE